MQEEFISLLTCPHTKKIFHTPVISNGDAYEDQICDDPNKIVNVALKSFITSLIDTFPNYKELQYKPEEGMPQMMSKKIMDGIMSKKEYQKILQYNNLSFSHLTYDTFRSFIEKATTEQICYFINNATNIDEVLQGNRWKPINLVFSYRPNDIQVLKCLIEKGGQMSSFCPEDNWYPLHQLCQRCIDEECLNFGIESHLNAGLSLTLKTNQGETIIAIIFRRGKPNVIKHLLTLINRTEPEFMGMIETLINYIDGNNAIGQDDKEFIINELLC